MAVKSLGTFDVGDLLRLEARFADLSGIAQNPTEVTLRIKRPSAVVDVFTWTGGDVEDGSRGVFYYDLALDEAGQWFTRWEGTGALAAVEEGAFNVRASAVL